MKIKNWIYQIKYNRILYFIVIFYLILINVLISKDLIFEHITAEDGLSQSSVTCITQDSAGFMWFGTYNGLNRYDGYNIVSYNHDDKNIYSISENYITSLLNDSHNILWIGTFNGLNIYNHKTEQFYKIELKIGDDNAINNITISAIYEDKDGVIWIGTQGFGLIKIVVPNKYDNVYPDLLNKLQIYRFLQDPNNNSSITSNSISDMIQNSDGNLWISTSNGLCVFNTKNEMCIKSYQYEFNNSHSLSSNFTTAIEIDMDNNIWIATMGGGLNKYDPDNDCFIRFLNDPANLYSISNNFLRSITSDDHGQLWIGSWGGGLNLLNCKDNTYQFLHFNNNPTNETSINGDYICDIYKDRTGVIWVGMDYRGLSKYDPDSEKFKFYNLRDETKLKSKMVKTIFKDSNGVLWIGTQGDGLYNYDLKTGSFIHYLNERGNSNSISNNDIRLIIEDRNDHLWIGTAFGLNFFDRKTNKFKTYLINQDKISNNFVAYIYEDSDGVLWIGTINGGLQMFNPATKSSKIFQHDPTDPSSLADNFIWCIGKSVDGFLWIGTNKGLCLFNKESQTFKTFKHDENNPNSLTSNRIIALSTSHKGDLLIGTNAGLNILDAKFDLSKPLKFQRITKNDGLPENPVRGIMEDRYGNLWLSNGTTLVKIHRVNGEIEGYNGYKTLRIGELKTNSYFKDKQSGHMYVGGINGFVYFHPDSIYKNKFKPSVAITEIKIHNKSISIGDTLKSGYVFKESVTYTKNIDLSYKENNISFEISALHYNNPLNNQFTFRLRPVEENWHLLEHNNRTASYYNLGPGKYTFQYSASNNNGVWNEEGNYVNFNIKPPFWLTVWFRILTILIVLSLIIYIYKLRTRRIKNYNKELEENVKQRTQQLETSNKELEAFAYSVSHDLRAPLRGINGYAKVIEEDYNNEVTDNVQKYINKMVQASTRMSVLIDSILKLSRIIRTDIKKERINLASITKEIIEEMKVAHPNRKVDVTIQSNMFEEADGNLIRIVLENLLQNAWKFTEKNSETKIEVGYVFDNKKKIYFVRDNGVGFDIKYVDKLFVPFNRLHSEKEFEGMGIGLASVKKIIDKHGGKIWAESQINVRTTFYFTVSK